MKIQLSKLEQGEHSVREELDEDHIKEIADSFEKDGQWNAILVKPTANGSGEYDVIAGHNRIEAAKRVGWDEIDAEVKDVEGKEADLLSLKTNLMRQEMKQIEQGRVLNKMLQEHGMSRTELADKIGKSGRWVSRRVKLALDLHDDVIELMDEGSISNDLATVVGSLDKSRQPEFANYLTDRQITSNTGAYEAKRRFENDTIYTIGYTGRDWDDFLKLLKENNIEVLVDVRQSSQSQFKPEFNGDVVADRLEGEGIEYIHKSELGVVPAIRDPYISGWIGDECFGNWYQWHIHDDIDMDFPGFVAELEETGRAALMCVERYHKAIREQQHDCHRHHLADLMAEVVEEDGEYVLPGRNESFDGRQLFPERVDL